MSISTKDIPTGGKGSIVKVLEPGNKVIKINKIYLDRVPWSKEGYNLMFDCEGPDLGSTFEGFFVNKEDESKGKHKGQVGRIRASRWLFEDKTISEDFSVERDLEIVKFLKHFCDAAGCAKWFNAANDKHDTIEQFVEQLNLDKPFEGKFLSSCVGGKQYESKDGYTNNDLFFPKFSRSGVPFESETVEGPASRVYTFTEKDHIVPLKPKTVESFTAEDNTSGFELD